VSMCRGQTRLMVRSLGWHKAARPAFVLQHADDLIQHHGFGRRQVGVDGVNECLRAKSQPARSWAVEMQSGQCDADGNLLPLQPW